MWVKPPFYGARAEKPPKKAQFAMKQTNICRLSGDIKEYAIIRLLVMADFVPRSFVRPALSIFDAALEQA